jgi:hypothetical protein
MIRPASAIPLCVRLTVISALALTASLGTHTGPVGVALADGEFIDTGSFFAPVTEGGAAWSDHDNDPPPTVEFTQDYFFAGEAELATVTVGLSAASGQMITVHVATESGTAIGGIDYLPGAAGLTFYPGQISRSADFGFIDDLEMEGDEFLEVVLSDPTNASLGARQLAYVVIVDDELAWRYFFPLIVRN